ncbi:MAG: DeoR family transcriptional regulator [Bacteroidales bacterium]|nr:DeoR family transcriptional regulator [Bacteroidales bacterium]
MTNTENVRNNDKMSETNVRNNDEMSETDLENVRNKKDIKKNKRQQAIIGLIKKIPDITVEYLSEKLDVNEKTIRRDISELKENGVLERIGGSRFGGEWAIIN